MLTRSRVMKTTTCLKVAAVLISLMAVMVLIARLTGTQPLASRLIFPVRKILMALSRV